MTFWVIVRGPLGVGKTTVSRRLAKRIGAKYISIDQTLEERDLWESGRVSEFVQANASVAELAQRCLGKGVPVIFDGNFYWKAQIKDLIGRLDRRHYVFTLKASLGVCVERDRHRPRPYGSEATRQVYAKSTRFEWGIGIDATRPLDAILREITSYLP
jgi:predicted kinase